MKNGCWITSQKLCILLKRRANRKINFIYDSFFSFFAEAQHALKKHIRERGIPTQVPVFNKKGHDYSIETFTLPDGKGNLQDFFFFCCTVYC